jgi:hypothetical protein
MGRVSEFGSCIQAGNISGWTREAALGGTTFSSEDAELKCYKMI